MVFWTLKILFQDGSFLSDESFASDFATVGDVYWGYIYVVVAANLIYVIFSIVGAVYARKGRMYYFIFFGKLAYHFAYKKRVESEPFRNQPPLLIFYDQKIYKELLIVIGIFLLVWVGSSFEARAGGTRACRVD